jgi:hypothetical protein
MTGISATVGSIAINPQSDRDETRSNGMAIQCYIGRRSKRIGVLQTTIKRPGSEAKFSAVEEFRQTGGQRVYVETPLPFDLVSTPQRINSYLDEYRSRHGQWSDVNRYTQACKSATTSPTSKGKQKSNRTARDLAQYSNEIRGNIGRKSEKRLKEIIAMAEDENDTFMHILTGRSAKRPKRSRLP